MSRPLRLEFPGAIYHLTSRGNARQAIFKDDGDREGFLEIVEQVVGRYGWLCHAYCLMTNHYHLLVETPDPNLSLGMRQLNGRYTQRYNRRHAQVGHLLQGRFGSVLVERESHLLTLCRYVVLNPVRAGMVRAAKDWAWSSYRATAGLSGRPDWPATDWVLGQFAQQRKAAQLAYRAFVAEGGGEESPWKELRGQVVLGSERFVARLTKRLKEARELGDVPREQRYADRPALSRLLAGVREGTRESRNRAIERAHLEYRYPMAMIARQLGLHWTTISKIVNRQR
jgi:putative transposase